MSGSGAPAGTMKSVSAAAIRSRVSLNTGPVSMNSWPSASSVTRWHTNITTPFRSSSIQRVRPRAGVSSCEWIRSCASVGMSTMSIAAGVGRLTSPIKTSAIAST